MSNGFLFREVIFIFFSRTKFFILLFFSSSLFSQSIFPKILQGDLCKEAFSWIEMDDLKKSVEKVNLDESMEMANWGICVYDPQKQEVVVSFNDRIPLIPASTNKLLTTETAYSLLEGDHRWKTYLEYSGKVNSAGVLNGNLFIIGSGDPTLGTNLAGSSSYDQIVKKFIKAIKDEGIKKIKGNIIVQNALFKSKNIVFPPDIIWSEQPDYYLPVTSVPNTKNERSKHFATVSKKYFYISSITSEKIYLDDFHRNGIRLSQKKLPEIPLILANKFRDSLIKSRIFKGKVIPKIADSQPERRKFLASEISPTLRDIIYFTNQNSSNELSESLLKIVGFLKNGNFALDSAKRVVTEHLSQRGYDFSGLCYIDGSGLSRDNAMTAYSQAKFLAQIMKETYFPDFFSSLPISGETGTLKNSFQNSENFGKISAKTGTLDHVKSLAGYLRTRKDNRILTFSVLINNYNGSVRQINKKIEDIVEFFMDVF